MLPVGAFGVPVPSWDGQSAFRGGCPLINPSRWWVPGGIHRRLQGGQRGFPAAAGCSRAAPRIPPSSPQDLRRLQQFHMILAPLRAPAKERADAIWEVAERCCLPPTFIAVLGDPLGSAPQNEVLRPTESGLTPKHVPEIFPLASETPGPLGRGSCLAG